MTKTTDFWVGDRFVRPSMGEIQLGPERVHLEPRSMEVLLALARSPSEVIPKKELIEAVWGESFVSDEVLTHAIWDLRRAFGDHASDPEFIQTIPKKGYRLIAPVRVDSSHEESDGPPQFRPSVRQIVLGLALIAVLAVATVWISVWRKAPPEPATTRVDNVLLLKPTEAPPGRTDWGQRLDNRLLNGLTGLDKIDVRRSTICAADATAEYTYCLEPILLSTTDADEISVSLREARSAREVYASPISVLTSGKELDEAAAELSDLVGAYFDVIRDPYSRDPDLLPWFAVGRHDPRAIRDFLFGVRYVYLHESGGRDAMAVAMDRDPSFIAPRVWRTPTIAAEADAEARAAHHEELERLYEGGTAFEKAMVKWARAIIDDDRAEQILQLEVALGEQPGNRPAVIALGMAHLQLAEFGEAWLAFDRLLKARWNFPGLYPLAAYCAVRRDRIDDLRRALDASLQFTAVDINSLVLLRLLAIFDGDTEREAELLNRLEPRRKEQPEGLDQDLVRFAAEYLAAKAEASGRQPIAIRLRESAN